VCLEVYTPEHGLESWVRGDHVALVPAAGAREGTYIDMWSLENTKPDQPASWIRVLGAIYLGQKKYSRKEKVY